MRLTIPPLTEDNISFKENDAFGRKRFGESLLNLIERTNEELVICLDSPWGEGKTTFVKMWQNLLKENKIKSIYFDAFSNDYIDDAFIALASQIVSFVENELKKGNPAKKKLDNFKKNAGKVGLQLLSWGAKAGIKAATLGIIRESEIEELADIKKDIAQATTSVTSKFIEDRISSTHRDIETIVTFRKTLEEFAYNINEKSEKPLVVIIDELDRCKPTYAIEILEKIKHIFSVKNIVFLLVMHKQQLEGAIKSVYGVDIDATTYLQKFIHVYCVLPKNRGLRTRSDYEKYCNKLFELHELDTIEEQRLLTETITVLARHYDFSLRQLEKTFTNLSIFYATVSERHMRLAPLIAFLAVIRVINSDIYFKLKNKQISYKQLITYLDLPKIISDAAQLRTFERLLNFMMFCVFSDEEYKKSEVQGNLNEINNSLVNYSIDRDEIIPSYCERFDLLRTN